MAAKDTLETFYRAVASDDMSTVFGLLGDDVEWTVTAGGPYAGTYQGPGAVVGAVFARLAEDWDGYKAEPSQLVAEGDDVVSFGTCSGIFKATGKSFSARFAHAVTVKNGKIVRFEQVVDSAEVNKALVPGRVR
jgi:ketosteroid isomerase-like protein